MPRRTESQTLSLSLQPSFEARKRKRQPSTSSDGPPLADVTNKQPRRIDPDRLAIRLGAELVGEMDAYIVPGAKMPSFHIRQALVTKYNVDRRHIYDYFHSRGLRVSKEDKHSNLSNRMRKASAAARKAPTPRGENAPVPASKPLPTKATAAKRRKTEVTIVPLRLPSPSPAPVESPSPSPEASDAADTSNNSSEYGESPSIVLSETLSSSPSFEYDESYELELVSLGHAPSEELCRSFGIDYDPSTPLLNSSNELNDLMLELDEMSPAATPISVQHSLLVQDDLARFSQDQRIEFYNLVNRGLQPEVFQSAGTYKGYMDRLYPTPTYAEPAPCRDYSPPLVYHPVPVAQPSVRSFAATPVAHWVPSTAYKSYMSCYAPFGSPLHFDYAAPRRQVTTTSENHSRLPHLEKRDPMLRTMFTTFLTTS